MHNPTDNVTPPFVASHAADVTGVLHGFDRLRLRGTLPSLYNPSVLARYLYLCHVFFKGFKEHARRLSERILEAALAWAAGAQRPAIYLDSTRASKEQMARRIAAEDAITHGPIALLRCVEPCQTYHWRSSQLFLAPGKCLHLYFYMLHPRFGFMHLRLQSGSLFNWKFASTAASGWPASWTWPGLATSDRKIILCRSMTSLKPRR